MTHAKVALAASVAEEGRKEAREEVIEDDQDEAAMISPGGRTGLLSVLWCTVCV